MANRSKAKGSKFERKVADYISQRGLKVVRLATAGASDKGDLYGIPNWVLELKATKALDLAAARREAQVEAVNAGCDYYASIHKKRQASIKDAYVEVPLWAFVDLLLAVHGQKEVA